MFSSFETTCSDYVTTVKFSFKYPVSFVHTLNMPSVPRGIFTMVWLMQHSFCIETETQTYSVNQISYAFCSIQCSAEWIQE